MNIRYDRNDYKLHNQPATAPSARSLLIMGLQRDARNARAKREARRNLIWAAVTCIVVLAIGVAMFYGAAA